MGKTLLLEQRKYGSNIKNHFYVVPFYFHIDFIVIENIDRYSCRNYSVKKYSFISNQDTLFKSSHFANKSFLEILFLHSQS